MLFGSSSAPGRSRLWWRIIPIAIGLAVVGWQYLGAPTFTNPETGRTARLGLSTEQETALGLKGFHEVTAQSKVIASGPAYDQVMRVSQRLAAAVGADEHLDWQVAVLDDPQQNAFCLPGGKICVYTGSFPSPRAMPAWLWSLATRWPTPLVTTGPSVCCRRT